MLMISIEQLHKEIQYIIHQIIFYKIIRVDLQFFSSIQNKRTAKQQAAFMQFCIKKYLKNPIIQIKMDKFSKLLIKKHYDNHQRKRSISTIFLVNKLDKYYQTIGSEGIGIFKNFPNPFKKHK